jgi:hypothetical protein
MSDYLPLITNESTLTTPGNISTYVFAQEIEHVVEVSGYDQIGFALHAGLSGAF